MKAVDTNILVYAHRRESHQHEQAEALVRNLAEGQTPWAIPWPCLYEFYSVVTNRRIWKDAASKPSDASEQMRAWTDAPSCRLLSEPSDFLESLITLVNRSRVTGAMVHDARIAALCLSHGIDELLTADRDFGLFKELKTHNPF